MFDCHAHLWDPAAGFPWLKAGSPHLRAYRAKDLETAGTGLGITGTVLVEASRGDSRRDARVAGAALNGIRN